MNTKMTNLKPLNIQFITRKLLQEHIEIQCNCVDKVMCSTPVSRGRAISLSHAWALFQSTCTAHVTLEKEMQMLTCRGHKKFENSSWYSLMASSIRLNLIYSRCLKLGSAV